MLNIEGLNSGYGTYRVLFDINMEIPKREITVVVGPNGAGKTTLINSIMGVATVFSGDISYEGRSIVGLPPHKLTRMGIACVPQMGNVFTELSVLENLRMAGYILEKEELGERIKEILDFFPVLKEFLHRKAGTLSGGERRMLAIAIGLIKNPKLLLLDEISTDLAPIIRNRVMEKIMELRDDLGITVLMVEQIAKKALEIGDNAYLLVSGEIRFRGKAEELLHHPKLARLYLGIKE
ncbi:MAG TPA: ABC transporter ATP-binding protein [Candidatus Bathyarchaeota archaeon]|nr:ABC transporter ATP-binding protein [Candidatus Bathyarchaeota archaeon]